MIPCRSNVPQMDPTLCLNHQHSHVSARSRLITRLRFLFKHGGREGRISADPLLCSFVRLNPPGLCVTRSTADRTLADGHKLFEIFTQAACLNRKVKANFLE